MLQFLTCSKAYDEINTNNISIDIVLTEENTEYYIREEP